jgi:hypothetical protein
VPSASSDPLSSPQAVESTARAVRRTRRRRIGETLGVRLALSLIL